MKKVLSCFSKKSSNGNNAALPISANTPPCYKQSASRLLLAVLFMLATVQGVWATVPTLEDLDFSSATSVVNEKFKNKTIVPYNTVNSDYQSLSSTNFGNFNYVYCNKSDNTLTLTDTAKASFSEDTCLILAAGSNSPLIAYIGGKTIGSQGAWRVKIAKSSRAYFGIAADKNKTGVGTGNPLIYLKSDNGTINIHNGSDFNTSVQSGISTTTIDICVIYNISSSPDYVTYGGNIQLPKNKAHVYINGTAVPNAENNGPKDFTIPSTAPTANAVFKVTPLASSGNKAIIDDVEIYSGLPSKACTKYIITRLGTPAGTVSGGTFSTDVSSACENATVTLTATPSGGYDFTSWTITKTADGTNITSNVTLSGQTSSATFTMPDYGVTVNATFTPSGYAITLDKNGGDSDGSAVAAENATAFTSGFTPPSRTGYDLLGYYLESEGTNIVADVNGDFTASVEGWTNGSSQFTRNATGTLYAKWSAKTSTVTLDNQSATTAGEDEVTATYDAAMRSIAEDLPAKTGHTFRGYYDAVSGGGKKYYNADGSSANNWDKEDAAVTLYAYWTPDTTTVTLDNQAATSSGTTEVKAVYGQVPADITVPTKIGYTFKEYRTTTNKNTGYQLINNTGKWQKDKDGYLEASTGNWIYTSGSALTIYAIWNPVYRVEWKVDGVIYHVDSIETGNKLASFPTPPSSLHESSDKEFAGWRTSAIDGSTDTDDALIDIYGLPAVTSDRTYYAVFGNQTDGSVDKETVFYSEDFSSYENYNVPSGSSNSTNNNGRIVYNDGNVTYSCTDGEQTTQIYNNGEVSYIVIGGKGGKFVISNLTKEDATGLLVTYKKKYNAKVYINYTDNEDESKELMVGGGINTAVEGVYSFIVDCRDFKSATTYSITFESTVSYGLWIDDIELKVYRPKMEKFVTNSYHNDLSSDEESPEAMNWSSAAWAKGVVPTINDTVVLSNVAMTVDVNNAKASKVILKDNSTLTISAGKALVVKDNIRKWDGENYVATEEEDIKLLSDGTNGTGALAVGEESTDTKATVQFYTKANANDGWVNQYFGIPVEETSGLAYYGAYLYEFDAEAFRWNNITSEKLQAFHPYRILRREKTTTTFEIGGTLVLPGTTTHKDKVLDLFRDEADYEETDPSTKEPYNTINIYSNSWAAPIAITAFEDGDFVNVEKTIYIFNAGTVAQAASQSTFGAKDDTPGQWLSLPISTVKDNPSNYLTVIPSQQAFLVYATGTPNEKDGHHLKLDYKKLVYDPAVAGTAAIVPNRAPRREAEEEMEMMCLKVEGESGYRDRVMIHMRSDFSQGFDNGWDGSKIEGNATAPQMYAITEGGYMSVNCVPTAEGTVIAFKTGSEDSNYNFTFDYDGEEVWYLNDLQEQESTMIDAAHSYQFSSTTSDDKARFVISKSPIHKVTTGVEGTGNDPEVHKLLIEDKLFIIRGGHMYSADGALVK